MNQTPTELGAAIVGAIDPQSSGAGTVTTGYISMKLFRRFLAILQTGAMTASSTVDAKLIVYTSNAGAGAADVSGGAITQLTQAGADGSKQVQINFDPSKLAHSGVKYTHFRLSVTVAAAASLISAIVQGFDPRYAPATDNDAATVDEIVSA